MDYGVTTDGFKAKRLNEILSEIETEFTNRVGQANFEPDSVLGVLNGIISDKLSILWAELENTYFARYESTAEGAALDFIANAQGLDRLEATPTRVFLTFFGDTNTIIPANYPIDSTDGDRFRLVEELTITPGAATQVSYSPTVADTTTYTVNIDQETYTYISGTGATAVNIITELRDLINANSLATATYDSGNDLLVIESSNSEVNRNFTASFNLSSQDVASVGLAEAEETGAILAPQNQVNIIISNITGLDSVDNLTAGAVGRDRETDIELRQRLKNSKQISGVGTIPGIRSSLLANVDSVISVIILENRDITQQNGMPPISFQVIIEGGLDQDIAKEIFRTKPAGVEPFGSTNIVIDDATGRPQNIGFTRPDIIYISVNVTITVTSDFPQDGSDQIKENIVARGDKFGIGDDVLYQVFFEEVYKVDGVTLATIEIGESTNAGTPPASFSSSNITINDLENSDFAVDRVSVTI